MTSTPVVLGIGGLGMPETPPDGDCAPSATGSNAKRKGIMSFIRLSSRFGLVQLCVVMKEYERTL